MYVFHDVPAELTRGQVTSPSNAPALHSEQDPTAIRFDRAPCGEAGANRCSTAMSGCMPSRSRGAGAGTSVLAGRLGAAVDDAGTLGNCGSTSTVC
jgi:hypothetical protein